MNGASRDNTSVSWTRGGACVKPNVRLSQDPPKGPSELSGVRQKAFIESRRLDSWELQHE